LRHGSYAVAAEFGDRCSAYRRARSWLPILISPGLIEGLAVAVDWPTDFDKTPHEAVRALLAMGQRPSLSGLMSLS
jgi:hypothetical protein